MTPDEAYCGHAKEIIKNVSISVVLWPEVHEFGDKAVDKT